MNLRFRIASGVYNTRKRARIDQTQVSQKLVSEDPADAKEVLMMVYSVLTMVLDVEECWLVSYQVDLSAPG